MKLEASPNLFLICFLVVIAMVGWLIFTNSKPILDPGYSNSIEQIDERIRRLDSALATFDSIHIEYLKQLEDIKNQQAEIDKNIEAARNEYSKKISTVSKLSVVQLDSFFTDRYVRDIPTKIEQSRKDFNKP